MAKIAYPRVVSGVITLIVGIVLAAVMLGVGWLAFTKIASAGPFTFGEDVTGLGLGVAIAGVMIGIGLIISQALAALRPK